MNQPIERIEILEGGNRLQQKRIASLEDRATKQEELLLLGQGMQNIIAVMSMSIIGVIIVKQLV